jgi:hypothetical protein
LGTSKGKIFICSVGGSSGLGWGFWGWVSGFALIKRFFSFGMVWVCFFGNSKKFEFEKTLLDSALEFLLSKFAKKPQNSKWRSTKKSSLSEKS